MFSFHNKLPARLLYFIYSDYIMEEVIIPLQQCLEFYKRILCNQSIDVACLSSMKPHDAENDRNILMGVITLINIGFLQVFIVHTRQKYIFLSHMFPVIYV